MEHLTTCRVPWSILRASIMLRDEHLRVFIPRFYFAIYTLYERVTSTFVY